MVAVIDSRIATLAPDFRALSVVVDAGAILDRARADEALELAYRAVAQNEPAWAQSHLEAWADVFRRFGAKPQRTPCSAEALRKRVVRDGSLPRVNPVVDLYNAVSLTIATGSEVFDTVKDGQPAEESPEAGEVVWRDDHGVTCRRWNWRQGIRTRLTADARRMWFILESLGPMPIAALHDAGAALEDGLRAMMPQSHIETRLLTASGSAG
jgi:DNA/RNA-binding domain of Phe-tRNA-synthetase-like protein